jgi:hypothetical protein
MLTYCSDTGKIGGDSFYTASLGATKQRNHMSGDTTGAVRWILRLEGLCVLIVALLFYPKFGFSWGTFALCFLIPDLSFLGYLAGPHVGALLYNSAHSYIGAISCLVAASFLMTPVLSCVGVIWCAHIGLDRALGYGLKYSAGFSFTHLGLIGRLAKPAPNPSLKQDT